MTTDELKMYFNEKFASQEQAVILQAKEYERRLENLNHEAQQRRHCLPESLRYL